MTGRVRSTSLLGQGLVYAVPLPWFRSIDSTQPFVGIGHLDPYVGLSGACLGVLDAIDLAEGCLGLR